MVKNNITDFITITHYENTMEKKFSLLLWKTILKNNTKKILLGYHKAKKKKKD